MLEDKLQTVDPGIIKVSDERPRQRKEMGEIEKLVESIRKFGQIQPIIVNRNMELIVGGRRLAACLIGGFQAKICFSDEVDPVLLEEMELEENVQRKALTPAEEVTAIAKLVELKRKLYGTPTPGRLGGFTLEQVAELAGKSKGSIIEDLALAEAIKNFPNLSECKTKADIKKAVKGYERIAQNIQALSSYEETIKRSDEFVLVNKDAVTYLKGIGDKSIDLFFTDPPYGIDIHENAMTLGGETGGVNTTTGIKYEDKFENVKPLLEIICRESFRVTKDTGHAYIFCGRDRFIFQFMYDEMIKAGWDVLKWPIVWAKRETGQNNSPDHWPSSAYEAVLFARKTQSRIVLEGRPDWIQCNPVLPSERVHHAEKPLELCKELISRVCLPGQYMLDCCMGSGALVEAGVSMKLLVLGCEKELDSYAAAVNRMVNWKDKQ